MRIGRIPAGDAHDRRFQMICAALPGDVQPIRLYESYLLNFEINTGTLT